LSLTTHPRWSLPLLLAGYALLVTGAVYLLLSHWVYDDPFITYRYARNLADGLGFVYNAGQSVLSTTTPLFTLVLAAIAALGKATFYSADFPRTANLIGAASLAVGALLLWDLARSWKSPIVGWAALLLYPTQPLILPTLSSETPLYLALCIGAFASYARQNFLLAGLIAGLATLARPDGVLVAVILGIHYIVSGGLTRRPFPWTGAALFLIITAGWYFYAWATFGTPFPATLAAKQQQGTMLISQRFAAGFLDLLKSYSRQWIYWVQAILAIIGFGWMALRERVWLPFLAWGGLYFCAYTFLGVSRAFWYYAPLAPGFIVLVGLGTTAAASLLPAHQKNRYQHAPIYLAVLLLIVLAVQQAASLMRMSTRSDARFPVYQAVGQWLADNTPINAKVGVIELGMIGYYAQRSMLDFAGLLYPDVAKQLSAETGFDEAALWAIEHYPLDYIVVPQGIFPRLEAEYLVVNCKIVKTFSGAQFGTSLGPQVIYACPSG
jgi:hypothetical protein